jgi:hypothetical protein
MARWSLRTIAPIAAVGCAALVASKAVCRRRTFARPSVADPPDRHLADDVMESLATSEGMPAVDEG